MVTSALVLVPNLAAANTISFAEVVTTFQGPGGGSAQVNVDGETIPNGDARAGGSFSSLAQQNADGTSLVSALAGQNNGGTELVTSTAAFTQTIENTSGMALEYALAYELSDLATRIRHTRNYGALEENPFSGDPSSIIDSVYTAASFEYTIAVNGTIVFDARADALAIEEFDPSIGTDRVDFIFENVDDFDTSIALDTNGQSGSFIFSVADIAGSIDLGTFADGESFDVTSTLTARSFATQFEFENGVGAFSFDPVTVSSLGVTSMPANGTGPSPVPLPAGAVLLLGALGGMAVLRQRKG